MEVQPFLERTNCRRLCRIIPPLHQLQHHLTKMVLSPEFVDTLRKLEHLQRNIPLDKKRVEESDLHWYDKRRELDKIDQLYTDVLVLEDTLSKLKPHPIVYAMFTNTAGQRVLATHFLGNTQYNYKVVELD